MSACIDWHLGTCAGGYGAIRDREAKRRKAERRLADLDAT